MIGLNKLIKPLFQAEEGNDDGPTFHNSTELNTTSEGETEEGGVSDELIGDALVVGAQVFTYFYKHRCFSIITVKGNSKLNL